MNQAVENKILKGNALNNNNLKNKIKEELQILNQKKIIKLTSIGITGLSALNMVTSKSAVIEKTLSSGLNTLLYGNINIAFMRALPIPNIVVLVLIVCIIGAGSLIITGNMDILLHYSKGNVTDILLKKGK